MGSSSGGPVMGALVDCSVKSGYLLDSGLLMFLITQCTSSECLRAYLGNYTFDGGGAIRYVLPVLWMTSHLHIMARSKRRVLQN